MINALKKAFAIKVLRIKVLSIKAFTYLKKVKF